MSRFFSLIVVFHCTSAAHAEGRHCRDLFLAPSAYGVSTTAALAQILEQNADLAFAIEKFKIALGYLNSSAPPAHDVLEAVMADIVKDVPLQYRPVINKFLFHLVSINRGDFSAINAVTDRFVLEEKFDEWLNLVHRFQRTDSFLDPSPQETWFDPRHQDTVQQFKQNLGIVPIAESQALFKTDMEWVSPKSLRKHFNKRATKKELEVESESELVALANQFLRSERKSQILFRRDGAIIVKYDTETQEISVVTSSGQIITYFVVVESYRQSESRNYFLGHFLLGLPYK